jgi:carboxyl-terminal processing protease
MDNPNRQFTGGSGGNVQMLRRLSVAIGIALIFTLGFATGQMSTYSRAQAVITGDATYEEAFAPLREIYEQIDQSYIDDVGIETLVEGAAAGMVDALGDPFSGYMSPRVFEMMNADMEGEIEGIGVVIRTLEESGQVQVVGILRGAPAEAAGIQRGDIFAEVDGVPVETFAEGELVERVRGPAGTDVRITMLRGDERIEFIVTRARITIPNVETRILEGDVAYLRLNQFSANAREEIDAAFESLDVNTRAGLIFDMRDNPGGLLSAAVEVASAFIEDGTILTEEFRDDEEDRVFTADGTYAGVKVPIIVLVNGGSASASELVAGAMQDRGAATIVGEQTFGKGTVQTWLPLSNGGGLRLTIARWLTPSGSWIHENGVTPDYVVPWVIDPEMLYEEDLIDPQMQAALDLFQGIVPPPVEATPEATAAALD